MTRNNTRWSVTVAGKVYKDKLTRQHAQRVAKDLEGCVYGVKIHYEVGR